MNRNAWLSYTARGAHIFLGVLSTGYDSVSAKNPEWYRAARVAYILSLGCDSERHPTNSYAGKPALLGAIEAVIVHVFRLFFYYFFIFYPPADVEK